MNSTQPSKSPYLQTALLAARAAEPIIRHYYNAGVEVRLKADQSPVTQADIEAEQAIKTVIQAAFPQHGIWGEETGQHNIQHDYLWLIDPIDGTKSFIRGYPFFSTQIALLVSGKLMLGVSNAPLFNECAYAERGFGAWLNGRRLQVSRIAALSEATLSTGNIATLVGAGRWSALGELVAQVNRIRGYGDFYHYHLLAAGKLDLVLESQLNILDIAALSVIVEEAGGIFTDLQGRAIDLQTTSVLASAHTALHNHALACLNGKA